MYLSKSFRFSLVLLAVVGGREVAAQQSIDAHTKEVQLGTNSFTLANPIPSWVDLAPIPEPEKPQPVVIRLAETHFLVDRVPVTFVRRATLINDAASLTNAGRFSIAFSPEYERVELHAIRIHRDHEQLDRTTTSNIRFLQREQGLENGIYSGQITASVLIEDLRVGDTLEISYSTYGQNPVFDGKYFRTSSWDQGLPTQHRRVVLNYPSERHIAWRMVGERGKTSVVPDDVIRGGHHKVEFDEQPLPHFVGEAQTPPDFFAFRFLQFSEFSSWNEVAKWAKTLFDAKAELGGELKDAVMKIRALDTDQARIAAALEFVQSQVRYFSVSLGESSHRPTSPDEVWRRRYGDCKDKSLLLIALLREMGIESEPALLQIGRHAGLEKTLPSPQFFNHVIVQVMVNGKTFFLDPTRLGQHGLLDRMGQAHEGSEVLIVSNGTNELSTVSADAESVGDEIAEHAVLSKLGADGELEIKRVWNGVAAEQLRVVFERTTRDQILKGIGDAMERRYPGAKLVGEPAIQDDTVNNTFAMAAAYKIPKLAMEKDGSWFVAFKPDNMQNVFATSPSATREMPLRIPAFPYHAKYSFEMTFPPEVSVVSDPRAETVANQYFNATVTEYFRGNIAKKTIDLATLRFSVDPENHGKYAEDLRAINKAIGGVFVVGKAGIKSDTNRSDLAHRLRDLRQEAIKKTTETIEGGKISGSDLADAHGLRCIAYADLERYEEALADANTAVRLAPNSPLPLSCRADVYSRTAQFEKSIADFSKAISLGSTDAMTFRGRGLSRFFAGRLEDAAVDLSKASELADKETRLYSDIWFAITYRRLGKPIPEDLVKRAAAEARGEWPRPCLAMLTGALSPDDVLKIVDEKKDDDRQMALAEASFYIGENHLLAGDTKLAQSFFEKTRELGVIIYIEHISAGLELARLKAGGPSASALPATPRPVAH